MNPFVLLLSMYAGFGILLFENAQGRSYEMRADNFRQIIARRGIRLVFLNACEVGRGCPALVGLGGFVSSFIRLGATAVIAPLWSVEDEAAHPIAEEFYRAVKDRPGTPFSRIFAEIRAKAYDPAIAKDSYAAYCFNGDPLASAR